METIDRCRGILAGDQRLDQFVWIGLGQDAGNRRVAMRQRPQRRADAAAHREFRQGRHGCRPRKPDADRTGDALGAPRGKPPLDRFRFEAELRHQRRCEATLPREFQFRPQRGVQRTAVDLRMALGVTSKRHLGNAVAFDNARSQERERIMKRTDRSTYSKHSHKRVAYQMMLATL